MLMGVVCSAKLALRETSAVSHVAVAVLPTGHTPTSNTNNNCSNNPGNKCAQKLAIKCGTEWQRHSHKVPEWWEKIDGTELF